MPVRDDVKAFIGHEVHVVRSREVRRLFRWLPRDLTGLRLLDVAGGDGYWAGQAARRGAASVCLDLARSKLVFGQRLAQAPGLVEGDALRLPFGDGTFDVVMSVCAIEHFTDGGLALDEMARVLRPGGSLVISADALTRAGQWPELFRLHRQRYAVERTYSDGELTTLLADRGLDVLDRTYLFRGARAEQLYLELSRRAFAWNLAAPLAPVVALADRRTPDIGGSVVCLHARRSADGPVGAGR